MIINSERALAYIVVVDDEKEIVGADNIKLAIVNGWTVIVKKDEIFKGDEAVFFEIDSKLPENDERFKFLEPKHYKVKTMKLGKFGVYSQGLLMPISAFPELNQLCPGDDVTKLLGVKYSVDEDNVRKAKADPNAKYKSMAARHKKLFSNPIIRKIMRTKIGRKFMFLFFGKKKDKPLGFPTKFAFVHKSDEERCENRQDLLGYPNPLVVTEKLDGCLDRDVSVYTDAGSLKICEIVNKRMDVNVLTYNESLGRCEFKPIKEYHKWERVSDMYDVTVSQQGYRSGNRQKHIVCTSEHSFYVGDGKYVKAKDLKNTDTIYHRYITIDPIAKEILLGMLIGDGSLGSKYGDYNCSVNFSHSVDQKEYFYECVRVLGEGNSNVCKAISGYGAEILRCHYYSNPEFKDLATSICITDGKKYISKAWANELTPISLAFWYMDDGSIQNADNPNVRARASISTHAYSIEECENLADALKNKYNINVDVKNGASYKGNVLVFNTENTYKFCALIAPYVCDSMKYKLPHDLRGIAYCLGNYTASNWSSIIKTDIISINKLDDYKDKYVYDLTVADNHNYFACGVLTHNTSSTYVLERKGKRKFEFYVCSRNVRLLKPDQPTYHDHNIYWDMAFKYDIENKLKEYLIKNPELTYVCIQGESVGSVQGNPLKLKEDDLYVFNFIRSDFGRLPSVKGKEIVEEMGMKFVPILDTAYFMPGTMEEVKEYATAKSAVNPQVMREGVVLRDPSTDLSFKNVSREYLLKHE